MKVTNRSHPIAIRPMMPPQSASGNSEHHDVQVDCGMVHHNKYAQELLKVVIASCDSKSFLHSSNTMMDV